MLASGAGEADEAPSAASIALGFLAAVSIMTGDDDRDRLACLRDASPFEVTAKKPSMFF